MLKISVMDREFIADQSDGKVTLDGETIDADIIALSANRFHVILNRKSYTAEIVSFDQDTRTFMIRIGNKVMPVTVRDRYDELLKQMGIDGAAGKKVNDIKAPMPGMVLSVMVENGQPIKKGDAIVVLEAMKMENILKSPADGIVRKIHVVKGDKVEKNQVMVNLD
jgi:biotin carboxyl carrier protein